MSFQSKLHRIFNIVTLVAMLFNVLPPAAVLAALNERALVRPAQQQLAGPTAPSAGLMQWPRPELPKTEPTLPDLDPAGQAIEAALGEITSFEAGNGVRLEPLDSNPMPKVMLPKLTPPEPVLINPLAKVEVAQPQPKVDPLADLTALAEEVTDQEVATEAILEDYSPQASASSDQTTIASPPVVQVQEPSLSPPPATERITYTLYLPLLQRNNDTSSPPNDDDDPPPAEAEKIIKPGVGGAVGTDDGQIVVIFSPASVEEDTRVELSRLGTVESTDGLTVAGPAFAVDAWTVASNSPTTSFPHQVTIISPTETMPGYAIITPSIVISVQLSAADVVGLDTRTVELYGRSNANQPWTLVPSAFYGDQGVLRAESDHLTEFVPMAATPPVTPTMYRIMLDPDDDVGHASWPGTGNIREITYNMQLAEAVKAKLEQDCPVEVKLTRSSAAETFVNRSLRLGMAQNYAPDYFVTLAFNALIGSPWGTANNGGVVGWARSGQPGDSTLVSDFYTRIEEYTTRPHRRPVETDPSGFYPIFDALPGTTAYAHIETLFLDHNYDWPVINTGFEHVVNGAYAAIRTHLETSKGFTCSGNPTDPNYDGKPVPFPPRPDAATIQKWRDLGYQNYQQYGADPVSFSTGNYAYQNNLFTLPGLGDLEVEFTLTYNAQDGRDDLFGYSFSFPYNARTQVYSDSSVSVVLHDGRTFLYEGSDGVYEPPAGVHHQLESTSSGWLFTMTDGTELEFEELDGGRGVLTEWRDRRGNALTFEYDLSGQGINATGPYTSVNDVPRPPLTSMTDTAGRTITFEADEEGHATSITLPDGRVFEFVYSDGNLTAITDPNGGTRRFEYDGKHRILKHWDPEGIMYLENIYDDEDRVVEQVDASGTHLSLTYDEGQTNFSDNLGHETRYEYDDLNRVTAVQDALGNTERFEYDDDYNLLSYTDKRGNTWTYTYDDRGNRLTETDPLGQVTTYAYNEANDLTSATDPLGRTVSFEYDEAGNLLRTVQPDGSTLAATYDEYGQMTSMTDPNGHTTHYTYNEYGDLTEVVDALGNVTRYKYDTMGRQIGMVDANGHTATFEYDGNDNTIRIVDPKGAATTFEYDLNDNLIQMADRLGRATSYEYDENLKLIAETNAENETTTYDYDLMYNLTQMTDPLGNSTLYRYDALYQVVEIEDALGGIRTMAYDPNGNIVRTANQLGNAATFEYDPLNRLVVLTDAMNNSTGYEYDGAGQLIQETNPRGAVTQYEYDLLGRRTLQRDALNGEWHTTYDAVGNVVASTDANGHTTTYDYDANNRLLIVTDANGYSTAFEYDHVGNRIAVADALGRVTTYAYDENDNLSRTVNALGGETAFAYDAEDNLVSRTDANGRTDTYAYDNVNRLVQTVENARPGEAASPDVNVTTGYEYDAMGNLLTLTDANGNPTTFEYDALYRQVRQTDAENQVTLYAYDAVGNLTGMTNPRGYATIYSYDALNRLTTTTNALGYAWQYGYDEVGNLVDQTDPLGVVTHHEYDLLDRLTDLTQNYVPGGEHTVEQNVITRFEYDAAGNIRFVYDPRGLYATEHRYDPTNHRIMTIDNEDGETEFVYDAVYNQITLIDGNDHETSTAYDALNRPIRVTNAEGHSFQFAYDAVGNMLTLTDARGYNTAFTYDGMYRLVLKLDALAGEWRYTYDAMGNLLEHLDANDHSNNSYTYDRVYRILSSTDGEGYVTAYTYDANGNRLTLTDGNTHTRTYTYDELDRLASAANAEDETTRYQYDPLGNQTHLIDPDGITARYDYDPLYRLVTVTENYRPDAGENADTNVDTRYSYDEVGNLLAILDAEEHQTRFSYDGMNRLIQEVDALDNTWDYEYDPVGNRTVRIDALRHRTEYSYYPDDEAQRIAYYDGTAVAYTYDENNNRVGMVDSLGSTAWVYDALNRMTDQTDPFGRHLGYAYDPVGNRTGLTYPDGHTVNYTYYRNNWLNTVIDPAGNITHYTRDGVGQVVRADNPNSTVAEVVYDRADRMLSIVNYQFDGARKTNSAFTYTYNDVGHVTQTVAEYAWRQPNVILTNDYAYDGLRRLIRDADNEGVWTEYTFDRVGNRLTLRSNNSSLTNRPADELIITYTYNAINQLLTTVANTHPGSPGLSRTENSAQPLHAFRHEVAAQRGKHISAAAADTLLAMADNLIADLYGNSTHGVAEVEAALDALRSQVQADRDSDAITSDGTANSLLAKLGWSAEANSGADKEFQTTTYTYDANGNRINKEFPGPQGPQIQGTDYTYDPENRLVVAHDYQMNQEGNRVDRQISRLFYDGMGRKLVKEYDPKDDNGGTKRVEYVYDRLDPVAEYNIWNPQYQNYYRGDLNRIITLHHFPSGTPGQMLWYHYDRLGSTAGLTKQSGQADHNYRYEPYGQIELPNGNFADNPHNPYTFTGQELDENMALYEFYARAYDYNTGTWLQQDSYRGELNWPKSLHRYGYVENGPVTFADWYGYFGLGDIGDAIGGAAKWTAEGVQDYANQVYTVGKDLGGAVKWTAEGVQDYADQVYTVGGDIIENGAKGMNWGVEGFNEYADCLYEGLFSNEYTTDCAVGAGFGKLASALFGSSEIQLGLAGYDLISSILSQDGEATTVSTIDLITKTLLDKKVGWLKGSLDRTLDTYSIADYIKKVMESSKKRSRYSN